MAGFIGALIGFWFGGWLWAIAGFFIGGMFSRGLQQNLREGYSLHTHGADIFFDVIFALLGYMAKADGRVSEDEIAQAEALMARLGITGEKRQQAIGSFKKGTRADFDLQALLHQFAGAARFRPDLKRNLIVFLVEMALSDDELHAEEERVLREVAHGLHIDLRSFEQMLEMLKAQHSFAGSHVRKSSEDELTEAYMALGVSPSSSDKDVKRAYRKLMSQYHPDKMIAKGVPEDMLAMATEKAQEIQAAYDVIEKARK